MLKKLIGYPIILKNSSNFQIQQWYYGYVKSLFLSFRDMHSHVYIYKWYEPGTGLKYYGREEGIGNMGEQYWLGDGYMRLTVLSIFVYV